MYCFFFNSESNTAMETSFVTCTLFIQCLLMLINLTLSEQCIQLHENMCACKSSKGTIDLSPLSYPPAGHDSRFQTEFGTEVGHQDTSYKYNPCSPIRGLCSGYNNSAVCQVYKSGTTNFSAGTQASVTMSGDPDAGSLMIFYPGPNSRNSTVKIVCDQSQEGIFAPDPGEDPGQVKHYIFNLTTKYGCYSNPAPPNPEEGHSGISIGSVLVIIFFVLLLIYIVGGMLFLHYVRGAQGIEMFPNTGFWKELPFLIKDGILFVFRGCKTDATYTAI